MSLFISSSRSEPSAKDRQIDGKALKLFQPSKSGNTSCGTGNDSWYGKIEIDDERKWVIRSQAA
jgi:hypothetical protein